MLSVKGLGPQPPPLRQASNTVVLTLLQNEHLTSLVVALPTVVPTEPICALTHQKWLQSGRNKSLRLQNNQNGKCSDKKQMVRVSIGVAPL